MVDEETGEVLLECNEEVTEAKLDELREHGINEFKVLFIDGLNVGPYLRDTLIADKVQTPDEAIMEIYRRLRPGDPPTLETAQNLFNNLFFNPERYDLSKVGRLKLNYKFKLDEPLDNTVLTKRGHPRDGPLPDRSQERQAARSTTSTTSATAACARSAS